MVFQHILYEKHDQIAKIMLNRPEKRNAQGMRLIAEMDEAFKDADRDDDIRVIILSGKGPSFSAGHDMSHWVGADRDDVFDVPNRVKTVEGRVSVEQEMYYDKCLAIRNTSKPTIAQVHGHCIAAGMMIAAMCDIIYASEDAIFSNPVLRMAASAAEVLFEPWDLNPRRAKELLFTADRFSAQDMFRMGFVNKVVPSEKLEEEVMALAHKIALTPPVTVRLTKASINRTMDIMGQTGAWQQHFMIHQLAHNTDEARRFKEARQAAGSLKNQLDYQKGNLL